MGILSIQSAVAAGHVGNSAACFVLQRLGFEVWRIDTVAYSNHPAHGGHRGRIVPAGEIAALLGGLDALGVLGGCQAVLSGFLGSAAAGAVVLDAVGRIRARRDDALYLCDPVFGDSGTLYADPEIVDFFHKSGIPNADIVTPNAFEAGHLTGIATDTLAGALAAARALRAAGPRICVVTGIVENGRSQSVAVSAEGAWRVEIPLVDRPAHGAGDIFAALLLGHLLNDAALPDALSRAASSVHALLCRDPSPDAVDLPLVAAQSVLRNPPERLPAEPIA